MGFFFSAAIFLFFSFFLASCPQALPDWPRMRFLGRVRGKGSLNCLEALGTGSALRYAHQRQLQPEAGEGSKSKQASLEALERGAVPQTRPCQKNE